MSRDEELYGKIELVFNVIADAVTAVWNGLVDSLNSLSRKIVELSTKYQGFNDAISDSVVASADSMLNDELDITDIANAIKCANSVVIIGALSTYITVDNMRNDYFERVNRKWKSKPQR